MPTHSRSLLAGLLKCRQTVNLILGKTKISQDWVWSGYLSCHFGP